MCLYKCISQLSNMHRLVAGFLSDRLCYHHSLFTVSIKVYSLFVFQLMVVLGFYFMASEVLSIYVLLTQAFLVKLCVCIYIKILIYSIHLVCSFHSTVRMPSINGVISCVCVYFHPIMWRLCILTTMDDFFWKLVSFLYP